MGPFSALKVRGHGDVDFVEAALSFISTLKTVDQHPQLYLNENVLQRAIHRYEHVWIPLLARLKRAESSELVPPLDVEWVWMCHMLSPDVYAADSAALLSKANSSRRKSNRILDHAILNDVARRRGLSKAESLWRSHFPNEPFSVLTDIDAAPIAADGTNARPAAAPAAAPAASSMRHDIVAAAKRHMTFYYQVAVLPHYRHHGFLKAAAQRYRMFFELCKAHPGEHLAPTCDIELMWRVHRLHPRLYARQAKELAGRFLSQGDSLVDLTYGVMPPHVQRHTELRWNVMYQSPLCRAACMFRGNVTASELLLRSRLEADIANVVEALACDVSGVDECKTDEDMTARERPQCVTADVNIEKLVGALPYDVGKCEDSRPGQTLMAVKRPPRAKPGAAAQELVGALPSDAAGGYKLRIKPLRETSAPSPRAGEVKWVHLVNIRKSLQAGCEGVMRVSELTTTDAKVRLEAALTNVPMERGIGVHSAIEIFNAETCESGEHVPLASAHIAPAGSVVSLEPSAAYRPRVDQGETVVLRVGGRDVALLSGIWEGFDQGQGDPVTARVTQVGNRSYPPHPGLLKCAVTLLDEDPRRRARVSICRRGKAEPPSILLREQGSSRLMVDLGEGFVFFRDKADVILAAALGMGAALLHVRLQPRVQPVGVPGSRSLYPEWTVQQHKYAALIAAGGEWARDGQRSGYGLGPLGAGEREQSSSSERWPSTTYTGSTAYTTQTGSARHDTQSRYGGGADSFFPHMLRERGDGVQRFADNDHGSFGNTDPVTGLGTSVNPSAPVAPEVIAIPVDEVDAVRVADAVEAIPVAAQAVAWTVNPSS